MTEREFFLAALELDPDQRAAYLDTACGTDRVLRQRLDKLLKAHEKAHSFLETPAHELDAATGEGPLGDYRLVGEIGRGGMGVVYEAVQISLGRRVALKVLPFAAALDARQLQRFKNEAQAAANLQHPHIVPVHGVGCERGVHYYAMQFIDGRTVAAMIAELRPLAVPPREDRVGPTTSGGMLAGEGASGRWAPRGQAPSQATDPSAPAPLLPTLSPQSSGQREEPATEPPTLPVAAFAIERSTRSPAYFRTVARLGVQAAAALEHAHGLGVVHRDIKPANLLVDTLGNLWVTDFGLALCQSQAGLTMTGGLIGTLRYMSPEQALAQRGLIDHRTDIYSLGVTLYELLTLEPVFDGRDRQELLRQIAFDEPRPPRRRNRAIPAELETVVLKAMEKTPADRYATAQEVADDLERFLKDEPIRAKRPSLVVRARKWAQRHQPVVWSAAISAVVLLVTGVVILASANVLIQRESAQKEAAIQERDVAQQARTKEQEAYTEQLRQALEQLRTVNRLVQKGRDYTHFRSWIEAAAAFTKASALRPDHPSVWNERAQLYSRLGLWDLAAADLAEAVKFHEADFTEPWMRHAQVCLYVGDTDGYRRLRARVVERFGRTADPYMTLEVCRICAFVPDPDTDPPRLVERAEKVVASHPKNAWYLYVLGAMHYRAGQYGPALQRAHESLAVEPPWQARALNYPILAMAHHRLGQDDEARQALSKGGTAIDQWNQELFLSPVGHWPMSGFWWDWMECQFYYREAKRLIEGSPPSEDWRLRVVRARGFLALGRPDAAAAEYTKGVESELNNPHVQVEVLQSRGRWYARLGRWEEAATDYAKAVALQPNDPELEYLHAGALLLAGHRDEYRRLCGRLLERLGQTREPRAAYLVARICSLAPDAIPEPARALQLAEQAVAKEPKCAWHLHTLGTAHYRAGQFDQAVRRLRESKEATPTWSGESVNWPVLAMAHYRLGDPAEAQRWLDKANQWHDQVSQEMARTNGTTLPLHDHDWLAYQLLRHEAEALLKGQKQDGQ